MGSLSNKSDSELVQAIRRGDGAAFEALYDRYRDWVVTLAWRFCRNREDARDVLQETFAYLHGKIPGFQLTSRFKTFLYPVVKHLALARVEKARRERPLAALPDTRVTAGPGGRLEDLLAGLSEVQQEVVLLRFADGLDLQQIAEALGVPLGTVKSRLHTALEVLRKNLPGR